MNKKQRDTANSFFEAVVNLIKKETKKLNFNYTLTGKVVSVVDNVNYTILINGTETNAKAINNFTYLVDDIVYILVPNNNMANKVILCKVP